MRYKTESNKQARFKNKILIDKDNCTMVTRERIRGLGAGGQGEGAQVCGDKKGLDYGWQTQNTVL